MTELFIFISDFSFNIFYEWWSHINSTVMCSAEDTLTQHFTLVWWGCRLEVMLIQDHIFWRFSYIIHTEQIKSWLVSESIKMSCGQTWLCVLFTFIHMHTNTEECKSLMETMKKTNRAFIYNWLFMKNRSPRGWQHILLPIFTAGP